MTEMFHYGIKGQKWGVRRYQNADGSLTSSGKNRYSDNDSNKKNNLDGVKNMRSSVKTFSDSSQNIVRKIDEVIQDKKKARFDLSKMSDSELRDRVNRMNLERQYCDLNTKEMSKGAKHAANTLSIVGDLAAVGSSVLGIALAIKYLKG